MKRNITQNLNQLGTQMLSVFDELRGNKIDTDKAKTLSTVACTVVKTARVQLDFEMFKHKVLQVKKQQRKQLENK